MYALWTYFLKMISNPYCALTVCLRILFQSCKSSQNVTFHNSLHEVDSKFRVNCHYGYEVLCFILSHITWWNNLAAVKINEAVGKRTWKASEIKYSTDQKKPNREHVCERVQERERNGYRTGTERIQNGYRMDTERKWNGCRTVTNHKNGKKRSPERKL